jgi:hypothetical protein
VKKSDLLVTAINWASTARKIQARPGQGARRGGTRRPGRGGRSAQRAAGGLADALAPITPRPHRENGNRTAAARQPGLRAEAVLQP